MWIWYVTKHYDHMSCDSTTASFGITLQFIFCVPNCDKWVMHHEGIYCWWQKKWLQHHRALWRAFFVVVLPSRHGREKSYWPEHTGRSSILGMPLLKPFVRHPSKSVWLYGVYADSTFRNQTDNIRNHWNAYGTFQQESQPKSTHHVYMRRQLEALHQLSPAFNSSHGCEQWWWAIYKSNVSVIMADVFHSSLIFNKLFTVWEWPKYVQKKKKKTTQCTSCSIPA